jgi:hypothetical protein
VTDEPAQTVVQTDPHRDPAPFDDHPFSPRERWFDLCRTCGYAEAAHTATTVAHGSIAAST